MMVFKSIILGFVAAGGLAISSVAAACPVNPPSGPVLLTVTWPQSEGPAREPVQFDRAALEAFEQDSFTTTTIWTSGPQTFAGVRLTKLLECLDVDDGLLTLSAQNEYLIEIETKTVRPDGALVAMSLNGQAMTTRNKGPLWVVYPYDADPAFQTETYFAQSIWQLDHIEVTP